MCSMKQDNAQEEEGRLSEEPSVVSPYLCVSHPLSTLRSNPRSLSSCWCSNTFLLCWMASWTCQAHTQGLRWGAAQPQTGLLQPKSAQAQFRWHSWLPPIVMDTGQHCTCVCWQPWRSTGGLDQPLTLAEPRGITSSRICTGMTTHVTPTGTCCANLVCWHLLQNARQSAQFSLPQTCSQTQAHLLRHARQRVQLLRGQPDRQVIHHAVVGRGLAVLAHGLCPAVQGGVVGQRLQ